MTNRVVAPFESGDPCMEAALWPVASGFRDVFRHFPRVIGGAVSHLRVGKCDLPAGSEWTVSSQSFAPALGLLGSLCHFRPRTPVGSRFYARIPRAL